MNGTFLALMNKKYNSNLIIALDPTNAIVHEANLLHICCMPFLFVPVSVLLYRIISRKKPQR